MLVAEDIRVMERERESRKRGCNVCVLWTLVQSYNFRFFFENRFPSFSFLFTSSLTKLKLKSGLEIEVIIHCCFKIEGGEKESKGKGNLCWSLDVDGKGGMVGDGCVTGSKCQLWMVIWRWRLHVMSLDLLYIH